MKHLTIQKRGDGGNHHPQVISGKRKDLNTNILVREVVIIERSYIAPVCDQCGSFKNLVPYRVSGKNGPEYRWRWVCSNHDGEGNCPSYEVDGKQVIEIPDEEVRDPNLEGPNDEPECDDGPFVRNCERCGDHVPCESIFFMGYSLWLCRSCAAAAYRIGEAI